MKQLMSAKDMGRVLDRMAYEIRERCLPGKSIAFLGIRTRGVYLADRLRTRVERVLGREIPHGVIDITLYRDDLDGMASKPIVRESSIPFDTSDKTVVLVDDVLFTGRTVRAALDQIMDYGRPVAVRLAVLVDRGGREMPIQADFTGRTVQMDSNTERVEVKIGEVDSDEGVYQG